MPKNTDELLSNWSPSREQAWWDKHWRSTPEWRRATFDNLEECFARAIVDVSFQGKRRTYAVESQGMAEIVADCLRCAGARVERPAACVVVCE